VPWIQPCQNHLIWSATSTLSGCGIVIWAKFRSFLGHIINKHKKHDDPLFNKCAHDEIVSREWLREGRFKMFSNYTEHMKSVHGFLCMINLVSLINVWTRINKPVVSSGLSIYKYNFLNFRLASVWKSMQGFGETKFG
jgi:hypothetical protein